MASLMVEEGEELTLLSPAGPEPQARSGHARSLRAISCAVVAALALAAVASHASPLAALTALRPRSVLGANALYGKVMLEVSTLEVSEGGKRYKTIPVDFSESSLHHQGAYVVDDGADVWLWLGRNAPRTLDVEATKAAEEYVKVRGDKKRKVSVVFDGKDNDDHFREVFADTHNSPQMFRVLPIGHADTEDDEAVEYEPIRAHVDSLESEGAYIVDPHNRTEPVYLWFGKEVSDALNSKATSACNNYIQASKWSNRTTAVIFEGEENKDRPKEEEAFLKLLHSVQNGAASAGMGGFLFMLMLVLMSS